MRIIPWIFLLFLSACGEKQVINERGDEGLESPQKSVPLKIGVHVDGEVTEKEFKILDSKSEEKYFQAKQKWYSCKAEFKAMTYTWRVENGTLILKDEDGKYFEYYREGTRGGILGAWRVESFEKDNIRFERNIIIKSDKVSAETICYDPD